jgi:hypothetical protein
MNEYWQALLHGKAEKHNVEKPREAASRRSNGEEAGVGGGEVDVAQDAVAI